MAVFLSKRLLRLVVLVGVCLGILAVMSPRGGDQSGTTQSYLSNMMPSNFDFSGSKLWGSQSNENVSEEKERYEAEKEKEKEQAKSEDSKESEESESLHKLPSTEPYDESKTESPSSLEERNLVWEYMKPSYKNKGSRPKACFVSLVRNEELHNMLESIAQVEKKFNKKFHYPWVFMNEKKFTDEFKREVSQATSGEVEFVLIPEEYWSYPDYIDQNLAADERRKMDADGVVYGESESYRHMCRFQSGFFWQQEALDKYDWYWRVEPGIKLYCNINYDVFQWMQDNEKAYGFTITIHEYMRTIESLWNTVRKWWKKNPEYIAKDNLLEFISEDKGESYNLCHFWSNFEVANLNLWRSPAYRDYFKYLDDTGNFFYERWGDAPVHSIAASLFLPKDSIHYFSDIGYNHIPYDNCPLDKNVFKENECECNPDNDFTFHSYACGVQYYNSQGLTKPNGWEKYNN
ncbi:hypothetical protein ZYGR_0S02730 [Zygosaccharomyces rouxii]|uniref:ZYRO0F08602p n=2 Tax=Zygosaccharomyces rouxii TaxID=4956 RepID=C5DXX8_ZYGRC|nr:uncharacterized protein ZYRO0F08602g [Zygosaccharomyces rouxii]KAH9199396.1 nucleotide-diphospho-sugar transferase [Zygosaccharomyces rouxii]GAV50139.1 hypothetical protein ZYGR_0S02730 [Zygosaccharomyces rouxii]CAR28639.1 ZYRO0F08602p [Zygosaccharomyces rouxii]